MKRPTSESPTLNAPAPPGSVRRRITDPNDPTPPGTPSSAFSVSSIEGHPKTPPKGRVLLVLLDGTTSEELEVDVSSSVGFLRTAAARWLKQVSPNAEARFDIVYNDRFLHNDYRKIYDICECYAADFVPSFLIVRKV